VGYEFPMRPVTIVGGGLAGLSLGIGLRQAEVPVTLYEAGRWPRHRVCGEFICGVSPETIGCLGIADEVADAMRLSSIQWIRENGTVLQHKLPRPALGLSRHVLDLRLAERLRGLGGDVREGARWKGDYSAPGVIACAGRRARTSPWIGLKIHAAHAAIASDLEVHLGKASYAGVARLPGGQLNICGLFRKQRGLRASGSGLLKAYAARAGMNRMLELLDRAELDESSLSAVGSVRFGWAAPRKTREAAPLVLGDTAALIPPFTGNGMSMAFESAESALGPVIAYARGEQSWPETVFQTSRTLRRRFRRRLWVAGLLHPFLLQPSLQSLLARAANARALPVGPLFQLTHA
jgi:flavin-dependent dehydrogenase